MKSNLLIGTAILFAVFLLLSGTAAAQDIPIDEVTKITVEGNEYVSDFEILNAVSTEVGDQTNQESLRSDMQSVFELGYFMIGLSGFYPVVKESIVDGLQSVIDEF